MLSESTLLNYTVLATIAEDYPTINAYCIHDAIMIEGKSLNQLLELITTKGESFLGFKPRFELQQLEPASTNTTSTAIPVLEETPTPVVDQYDELFKNVKTITTQKVDKLGRKYSQLYKGVIPEVVKNSFTFL